MTKKIALIAIEFDDPDNNFEDASDLATFADGLFGKELPGVKAHMIDAERLMYYVTLSDETECRISWDSTYLCWNLDERFAPDFSP